MVQYKKDEIKEKIDQAALRVFAKKGYRDSKISDIAKKAGISVGNIYRYYKSKDDIFYTVVPERFIETIRSLLVEKVSAIKEKKLKFIEDSNEFWLFNNEFIHFMVNNRERMLIVFHNNKGTKYENAKDEVIQFIMTTVRDGYRVQYNQFIDVNKDDFAMKIIYENLMHMILRILEEAKTVEEVMKYLKSINIYHMFGITGILK
ncbi:MAG: TetR/AcrR family transcriptional regulator [Marinisporobacter sp.]|jgi:AcrR family transcriptional regulator|nr:TetR/AcrR family transcriptional regulator [Marinisporobacter sp.]